VALYEVREGDMKWQVLGLVLVGVCAMSEPVKALPVQQDCGDFRAIHIAANTIERQSALSCYVEADFRLSLDGVLVTAHDDSLTGNCGKVSARTADQLKSCTLGSGRHIATLAEFLAQPLAGWYLDLKDTESTEDALEAVKIAAEHNQEGMTVMMYDVSPAILAVVREHDLDAVLKFLPTLYIPLLPFAGWHH